MSELTVPVWYGQILVETLVARTREEPVRQFLGLVDTGSQRSAVSERVLNAVGPTQNPVEYLDVGGIGSSAQSTPAFWFWLGIELDRGPSGQSRIGQQMSLWRLPPPAPPNFDILLGMDFLSLFEITMNGRTCTFRLL